MSLNPDFIMKNLFLENEFRNDIKASSNGQYVDYVKNIQDGIFSKNNLGDVLDNLDAYFAFSIDDTFILLGFMLKMINKKIKTTTIRIDAGKLCSKSISNYHSGFNAYIKFLKSKSNTFSSINGNKITKDVYNESLEIAKRFALNIDGTDSLLELIGAKTSTEFIKMVLNHSYFFDTQIVKDRFSEISSLYSSNQQLPSRWTEWYNSKKDQTAPYPGKDKKTIIAENNNGTTPLYYTRNGCSCRILIDKDGNYALRNLIKDKTGYTISQGRNSIFQFYKISHIWGEAYDPRKFTNLWNVVLVPAWANDLLDKQGAKDSLTLEFQETIKAICLKFYKMKRLNWSSISMSVPTCDNKYVKSGNYNINWIEEKGQNILGKIHRNGLQI